MPTRPTRAYGRLMQDAAEVGRRKRRSNRAVLGGLGLIALALLVTAARLLPPLPPTLLGVAGFALLMYGVHLAWTVFYDREPDGPPS